MTQEESKYKREIMFRKNKGKQEIDIYRRKISSLFSVDINSIQLLSLEDSDIIRRTTFKRKSQAIDQKISDSYWLSILQDIKLLPEEYYVFIDNDWEYCGCFKAFMGLLNETFKFGQEITDDLVLISSSLDRKIALDYYEMNGNFYIEYDRYEN